MEGPSEPKKILKTAFNFLDSSVEAIVVDREQMLSNEALRSRTAEPTIQNAQLAEQVRELELTRDELAALLAGVDPVAVLLDHQVRIRRYTPAAARLLRLAPADIGERITSGRTALMDQELGRDVSQLLTGTPIDVRDVTLSDGRCYLRSLQPQRHDCSTSPGVVVLFTDVTRQRQAERELQEQTLRLDRLGRHQSVLLSLLGHELRNPLMPIINAIQLIAMHEDDSNLIGWATAMLKRQSQRLMRLVDNLLDVGRLQSGVSLKMERERIVLQDVLREVLTLMSSEIETHDQQVHTEQPDTPVLVQGDFRRLAQALSSLLDHAIEHTPKGGQIQLHLTVPGDRAEVSITDYGQGMDAGVLERIFDPFSHSVSDSPTRPGLGFGLYLAKQLVALHQGRLVATRPEAGQGNRFMIYLPLAMTDQVAQHYNVSSSIQDK